MTIKWTGSKAWLRPVFRRMEECYEPFAGSAAISLTHADKIYLNDACLPLTQMYNAMAKNKEDYLRDVNSLFNDIQNAPNPKARFYEVRSNFRLGGEKDPVAFLAILYAGFNGLWRSGPNGCNVPYGGPRNFPYDKLMLLPAERIASVTNLSWEQVKPPNDTCVVYADPPFATTFTGYNAEGFTVEDNIALFNQLASLPNPVIISCLRTKENEELLKERGFDFVTLGKLYRNGQRGSVKKEEILAFNDKSIQYIKFSELRTS